MSAYNLKNTDGFIISASILYTGDSWVLNVKTKYGGLGHSDWFKTLRGAKQAFALNFKKGAIWEEINLQSKGA